MPNLLASVYNIVEWSVVSNAALRSNMTRITEPSINHSAREEVLSPYYGIFCKQTGRCH